MHPVFTAWKDWKQCRRRNRPFFADIFLHFLKISINIPGIFLIGKNISRFEDKAWMHLARSSWWMLWSAWSGCPFAHWTCRHQTGAFSTLLGKCFHNGTWRLMKTLRMKESITCRQTVWNLIYKDILQRPSRVRNNRCSWTRTVKRSATTNTFKILYNLSITLALSVAGVVRVNVAEVPNAP